MLSWSGIIVQGIAFESGGLFFFSGMTETKSYKEQDGYSYHSMDSELSDQYNWCNCRC